MDNSERRDIFAAGHGTMDAAHIRNDRDFEGMIRRRLEEAEAVLVRLREHANRIREEDRTGEHRDLIKLLDDAGSPLAYLVGFVESTVKQRTE